MENMPAGWYRNSEDRRQHGYWDGFAWDEAPDDADSATARATERDDTDEPDQPGEASPAAAAPD